jgi:hypothetical protein
VKWQSISSCSSFSEIDISGRTVRVYPIHCTVSPFTRLSQFRHSVANHVKTLHNHPVLQESIQDFFLFYGNLAVESSKSTSSTGLMDQDLSFQLICRNQKVNFNPSNRVNLSNQDSFQSSTNSVIPLPVLHFTCLPIDLLSCLNCRSIYLRRIQWKIKRLLTGINEFHRKFKQEQRNKMKKFRNNQIIPTGPRLDSKAADKQSEELHSPLSLPQSAVSRSEFNEFSRSLLSPSLANVLRDSHGLTLFSIETFKERFGIGLISEEEEAYKVPTVKLNDKNSNMKSDHSAVNEQSASANLSNSPFSQLKPLLPLSILVSLQEPILATNSTSNAVAA